MKIERTAPLILIVLTPLVLFWRLVFAGEVLYWGVPLMQFYPWHTLANRALASGQWPLWTDWLGNGAPLLANHQTALFYPPNLLFRLFPVEHALGYSVVLHVIGAGLAATYWGHTLSLGRLGRTVTALSYALGGYVIGRTQFITMVAAYAWLPLLLALTERLVQRRDRNLYSVWLGGALALQFLAGHVQIWFYSLVLVTVYGLYRCACPTPSPTLPLRGGGGALPLALGTVCRDIFVPLRNLALGILFGVGLSAIQLLPTAELVLNSQRSGGTDWAFAMTYSFWPWRLFTLIAPDLFGNPALGNYAGYANYWEDATYIGLLPLLFAIVAVVHWLKTRRPSPSLSLSLSLSVIPFFALLLPVAVLLAMGQNTPLFPLVFKYVPGFGFFQAPARLMLWFAIGASTLAGIGAHTFRLSYWSQYTLRLTVAGAGAMLAVSLTVGRTGLPLGEVYLPAVTWLAVTLGLSAGLLLLRGREADETDRRVVSSPLPRLTWGPLVIGLVVIDLLWFGMPLTPAVSHDLYRLPNPVSEAAQAEMGDDRLYVDPTFEYNTLFKRYFPFDTFGPPDLAHWRELRDSLLPNLNAVDGVRAVNNYEPLVIGRWRDLLERLAGTDWPARRQLLRMMNVGYLLAESQPPDSSPVAGVPHLYRLSDPLPRAWVVPQMRVITVPGMMLSELMAPTFDPAAEVLLETSNRPADTPPPTGEGHPSRLISLREGWNSRTIDLVVSQPGYLVLAYTYYPGWGATVDDQPVRILRANYALMALPVEAGEHRVVLRYRPISLKLGAAISGLSALAMIGMVIRVRASLPGKIEQER